MLKGCQRRIIMVKDTKNPCIDTAYFVLKNDAPSGVTQTDMLTEAARMLDACSVTGYLGAGNAHPRRRIGAAAAVIAAAGLGLVTGAAAMLLLL